VLLSFGCSLGFFLGVSGLGLRGRYKLVNSVVLGVRMGGECTLLESIQEGAESIYVRDTMNRAEQAEGAIHRRLLVKAEPAIVMIERS